MVSSARDKKNFSDHCPSRTREADIDIFILQLLDGNTSLVEIGRQAFEKFPSQFITPEKAFDYAAQLTEDYAYWSEGG